MSHLKLWILLLLLGLSCLSARADGGQTYVFRGQTLQLRSQTIDGKECYSLDDGEVRRLVGLTFAQVQFSSSGSSLYVFLPGRKSFWSERSDTVTVNGLDMAAPGFYFPERKALEPQALFLALGLRSVEGQLLPVVTSIGPPEVQPSQTDSTPPPLKGTASGRTVAPLVMQFSCPAKPVLTTVESDPNVVNIEIPDFGWDEELCPRKLHFTDADCEVMGGDKPGSPLIVHCHLHPYWEARLQMDLSGSAQISFQPTHLFRAPASEATLQGVEMRSSDGGEQRVRFLLDQATQFSWGLEPLPAGGERLVIDLAAVHLSTVNPPPAGEGFSVAQINAAHFPVVRCEIPVSAGQSFDFAEANDPPHTLVVRLAPKGRYKSPDAQGMATTGGFLGGSNGATVVIDPGHGGGDGGCQNHGLGVQEKDVTLDISLRLAKILEQRGFKVVMTRNDDRDVTYAGSPDAMELQARADVANNINADIFVSIHCNASVNYGVRGSSVYYYKEEDYALAQSLDVLGSALGFEELGVLQNRFAVLRLTSMPAALVETAFLSNPTEGAKLADANVRQSIAERLAQGLERYLAGRKTSTSNR